MCAITTQLQIIYLRGHNWLFCNLIHFLKSISQLYGNSNLWSNKDLFIDMLLVCLANFTRKLSSIPPFLPAIVNHRYVKCSWKPKKMLINLYSLLGFWYVTALLGVTHLRRMRHTVSALKCNEALRTMKIEEDFHSKLKWIASVKRKISAKKQTRGLALKKNHLKCSPCKIVRIGQMRRLDDVIWILYNRKKVPFKNITNLDKNYRVLQEQGCKCWLKPFV